MRRETARIIYKHACDMMQPRVFISQQTFNEEVMRLKQRINWQTSPIRNKLYYTPQPWPFLKHDDFMQISPPPPVYTWFGWTLDLQLTWSKALHPRFKSRLNSFTKWSVSPYSQTVNSVCWQPCVIRAGSPWNRIWIWSDMFHGEIKNLCHWDDHSVLRHGFFAAPVIDS